MKALTTALGMVPMAVSAGEGAEMWRPMGIVVIGGLVVSTLITLIIVPILYSAFSDESEEEIIAKKRKDYIFMQLSTEENNQE